MYDNSMSSSDAWLIFVLFLVALLIVLFIIRGILLWYWKIDKAIENQQKSNDLLQKILDQLNKTTPL